MNHMRDKVMIWIEGVLSGEIRLTADLLWLDDPLEEAAAGV